MSFATEQELEHLSASSDMANHDRDLVQELSRRLDTARRLDQYIANADWRENLKHFWGELKQQEEHNIARMKQLLIEEIRNECF